jgi:hypothetical protein
MSRLDRLHLECPFAGSRMLLDLLAAEGSKTGRRHVMTLMRRMGIEALYRRPHTTKPEQGHKIFAESISDGPSDCALQQRTSQQLAGDRRLAGQLQARTK